MKCSTIAVVFLLVAVVAVVHSMPQQKRDDENENIGKPAVAPEEKPIDPPNEDDIAANDDAQRKKRFMIDYGSSSSSSSSSLARLVTPAPYTGPPIYHSVEGGTGKAPGCLPKYKALKQNTMCVFQDDPSVYEYGISPDDIKFIVDKHNEYRKTPNAKDMTEMYWDDEIAILAQKLAQACHKGHDPTDSRKVPGMNIELGQNWAGGQANWALALKCWYDEVKDFTYGGNNDVFKVGHYGMIMDSKATAVGCGFARCGPNGSPNYFCNYSNLQGSLDRPWTPGTDCASCPGFCKNGLCDCGKKFCANGLDLSTCTCN